MIGVAGIVAGYLDYGFWALLAIPAIIVLITLNMARIANGRIVILALLGLVVGQAVVWYTGQFYALFFLGSILKADLSDGELAGCLVADHRHAVLPGVRRLVRPYRPALR